MTCGFRAKIWIHVIWLPKSVFLGCLPGAIKSEAEGAFLPQLSSLTLKKAIFFIGGVNIFFMILTCIRNLTSLLTLTHVLTSWYWKCGISFELGGSAPWPGEDNRTLRFPRILSQKNIGISCHFHRFRQEGDFRSVAFKVPFSFEVLDAWECRMPKKKKILILLYFFMFLSSPYHCCHVFLSHSLLLFCMIPIPQQRWLLKFKILSPTCTSKRTREAVLNVGTAGEGGGQGLPGILESGPACLCSFLKHLMWFPWTVVFTDQLNKGEGIRVL